MKQNYIVDDIDEFTEALRLIVFTCFGKDTENSEGDEFLSAIHKLPPEEKKEIDRVLTHNESLVIVKNHLKKQKSKKTGEIRYILTDDLFSSIVEDLNSRMVSNILRDLTSRGIMESAYDSELNDFVFWVKDEE